MAYGTSAAHVVDGGDDVFSRSFAHHMASTQSQHDLDGFLSGQQEAFWEDFGDEEVLKSTPSSYHHYHHDHQQMEVTFPQSGQHSAAGGGGGGDMDFVSSVGSPSVSSESFFDRSWASAQHPAPLDRISPFFKRSPQEEKHERRKAQNREAQRSYRRRRDALLERAQSQLKLSEQEIIRLQTENEEMGRLLRSLHGESLAPGSLPDRRPRPDKAYSPPAGAQKKGRHEQLECRYV
ncbi:hypothetical protein PV08_10179 [Exophiala spinifera]|uniref:BZIP domain-containing protein n=1 Tax=Exophiala spinifera TaxID=91928 RepID=A0A0D2AWN5_9EURO|nr:uncharacterized protein PV08_10179 [Exophiala spinifera]KIW10880.1 hypothetical protein PV08_10179 [Exophiala spinifera]